MLSISDSHVGGICIATLGASFIVFASTKPVRAQELSPQKTADIEAVERRIQAAYKQIAPAIVRITYGAPHNREWTRGSGTIVTEDGYVVTCALPQSLGNNDLLAFYLPDGRRVEGKALGWSTEWNVGLLKITEKGPWPHVDLGRGTDVKAGQLCVALGYQDLTDIEPDRWPALRAGCVTKSAADNWLYSSSQLKVFGHGVFDLEGRLLGLTQGFPSRGEHRHTSVEHIRAHWDHLVADKNVDRVRLLSSETRAGESPLEIRSEPLLEVVKDHVPSVIEKAKAATVRINEENETKRIVSGVIVTADGYLITCGHHRRLPGMKVKAILPDGRKASAVILGTNPVSDVGLMKITDEGPWPHVEMGHSTGIGPGDRCVLMGYPIERPDLQPWISEAQIIQSASTLPMRDEWSSQFWTSGDESQSIDTGGGISGGGVFDLQGRVVGVVLGGLHVAGGKHHRCHARIEMFRKQWELLATSKPVDVFESDPFAEITAALRRIASDLPPIAVEVLVDGMPRVLGTIVGSDGRILTKASELGDVVSCRLADGRVLPADVQKVFKEHDLALLKIDAVGLPETPWSEDESVAAGTLIAAIIPGKEPQAGLVELAPRIRPPARAGLGVNLKPREGNDGLEVHGETGLDIPLRKGDVLVHIEDRPTPNYEAYLGLFWPKSDTPIAYAGDTVRVGLRRGGDTLEIRFALTPSNFWCYDASTSSRRWWGFPSVFGTDIKLTPQQCGGPVIDKSGRVVGITIACQGESGNLGQRHVIPAHIARGVVAD